MEAKYAAKEVERLSGPLTAYLEMEPLKSDPEQKFTLDTEKWMELLSMGRAADIESSRPPQGTNKVTIEAPYLLTFIRLGRCWLDGVNFGKRLG